MQPTKTKNPVFLPPASLRVLAIPELLSLIFSFLAHSEITGGLTREERDPELSPFSLPICCCMCSQCNPEHYLSGKDPLSVTGPLSLPSPFSIPLSPRLPQGGGAFHLPHRNKSKPGDSDDEDDVDESDELMTCHCHLPVHRQLSGLFDRKPTAKRRPMLRNKPSYNLNNSLVCKTWSPIALDVLWRVVDRPERLFALLDGAWGSKFKPDAHGVSQKRLTGLRGLYQDEKGEGRMPRWWKPGVQAFLGISRTEEEVDDDDSDDDEYQKSKMVRRREYELFSFRAPPTPASWARFDRYARRMRHLVYTRPCLTESAMNHIAVTRPRLAVFPRMHTLTWADNPLNHAVLFMHEGVRRFEMRIEVFGYEKVDPQSAAEQTFNTYNDLGLNDFTYSGGNDGTERMSVLYSVEGKDLHPNRSITRSLATQLAEIPRRMPNIQTLCISSYIPVSLYLPALLCTLLRAPPAGEEDESQGAETPSLAKLRTVVLPRFYNCAAVLERLAHFPQLQVVEYQFDDALGWGRPGDVGLGKCVPRGWESCEPPVYTDRKRGSEVQGGGWFGALLGAVGVAQAAVDGDAGGPGDEDAVPGLDPRMDIGAPLEQEEGAEQHEEDTQEEDEVQDEVGDGDAEDIPILPPPIPAALSQWPALDYLHPTSHRASRVKLGRYGATRVVLASELEPETPSSSLDDDPIPPIHESGPTRNLTPSSIFQKLYDLNMAIPITEARDMLLSSPPAPVVTSPVISTANSLSTATLQGIPTWPQNLISLYIDAPPGILATPMEVRSFIHAVSVACYGPSGGKGAKPARLERLGVVCSADPDSGYESVCGAYGTIEADGEERYLSMKTLEPLLELLPPLGTSGTKLRPKFALKSFDIRHHFPLYLTQGDVEVIAERWGGCIQKLWLNDEPIAGFGITRASLHPPPGVEPVSDGKRPEASLTLAALLPLARHCTELRQLGLFLDASRGVRGLMKPIFHPESVKSPSSSASEDLETDIDSYTFNIAKQYISSPLSDTAIPDAYPIFRTLERLNVGVSVLSVGMDELDLDILPTDSTTPQVGGLAGPNTVLNKVSLTTAIKEAARVRIQEEEDAKLGIGCATASVSREDESDDERFFLKYISRRGVRLGIVEEDEHEHGRSLGEADSSQLVPLFLAQILPCFPAQDPGISGQRTTSDAFTTVLGAGTTWTGGPSSLMGTSWAIQENWSVGEPYEVEKEKERRRRRRERLHQEQQMQLSPNVDMHGGAVQPAPTQAVSITNINTNNASNPSSEPTAVDSAGAISTSSVVIPFLPPMPAFAEPSIYLSPILASVFRARIKKWVAMNESILPMAVAMREGGRVWGGRVSSELGRRREEVDELQVRVGLMSGLVKARGGKGGEGEGGVSEGCVIV